MKWFEYAIAIMACVLLASATPLAATNLGSSGVSYELRVASASDLEAQLNYSFTQTSETTWVVDWKWKNEAARQELLNYRDKGGELPKWVQKDSADAADVIPVTILGYLIPDKNSIDETRASGSLGLTLNLEEKNGKEDEEPDTVKVGLHSVVIEATASSNALTQSRGRKVLNLSVCDAVMVAYINNSQAFVKISYNNGTTFPDAFNVSDGSANQQVSLVEIPQSNNAWIVYGGKKGGVNAILNVNMSYNGSCGWTNGTPFNATDMGKYGVSYASETLMLTSCLDGSLHLSYSGGGVWNHKVCRAGAGTNCSIATNWNASNNSIGFDDEPPVLNDHTSSNHLGWCDAASNFYATYFDANDVKQEFLKIAKTSEGNWVLEYAKNSFFGSSGYNERFNAASNSTSDLFIVRDANHTLTPNINFSYCAYGLNCSTITNWKMINGSVGFELIGNTTGEKNYYSTLSILDDVPVVLFVSNVTNANLDLMASYLNSTKTGWIKSLAVTNNNYGNAYPSSIWKAKTRTLFAWVNGTGTTFNILFDSLNISTTPKPLFYYSTTPIAYETNYSYLLLNMTFNDTLFKNVTANLTWNGTTYPYTNTTGSDYTNFTTKIGPIPLLDANDTKILTQWNYTFTYLNGTTYAANTTETNQSIYFATYFLNITAAPNPAATNDVITITSYLKNLASAGYVVAHYVNSTNTAAPYTTGGAWISTFTTPATSATEIVNGTINVTFGGVSKLRYSTSYTVNVIGFALTLCPGILIYNFSTINEDTLARVNGSQYMTFTVWNNARTINQQFNFTFYNVTYAEICASVNGTVLVDSFQVYNSTGYGQRAYLLYNATLNISMATQNITLYSQIVPPSKPFRITVKDANDVTVKSAYISALRWYPGNNTYLTVAMIYTDDNGQGYTYLQPNDVWYYFIQNKAGVITTFTSRQAICDTSYTLCDLTLKALPTNTSGSAYLNMIGNIQASCTDNPATNFTSCTFIDASGYYHEYTLTAVKQGIMTNTIVCNTTVTTSSGTITCLLNAVGQYAVELSAHGSPAGSLAGINVNRGNQQSLFAAAGLSGASGAILALPIVITVILGSITAPATGLVFGVFAIILMGVLGLYVVTTATIAVLIIFAILVAWKLKV